MMTTDSKRITRKWLCLLVLLCGALAGCVDDNLIDCLGGDAQGSTLAPDEYGIAFELSLDNLGGTMSTRADGEPIVGTEYENYVNFDNMRVLMFDTDDNYICDVLANSDACNVVDRSTGNSHSWYIEIILSRLDENIQERFQELVKDEGFKVAVFANWDRRSLAIPDYKVGDEKQGKLSYIAHCLYESTYAADKSEEGHVHNGAYAHLIDEDGNMGAWYDWVENHFSSIYQAYNLIHSGCEMRTKENADIDSESRLDGGHGGWKYYDTSNASFVKYDQSNGFYYERTERDRAKYTFKNIWKLWNFSNGKNFPYYVQEYYVGVLNKDSEEGPYSATTEEPLSSKWSNINEGLVSGLQTSVQGKDNIFNEDRFNELTVNLGSSDKYDSDKGCVTLKSLNNNKTWGGDITTGYLKFQAEATGTLHVRFKRENKNSLVGVHRERNQGNITKNNEKRLYTDDDPVEEGSEYDKENPDQPYDDGSHDVKWRVINDRGENWEDEYMEEFTFRVKVSNDPIPVYVYVAGGGSIDFYEVEFVKDEYIYQLDRIGKEPGDVPNNEKMGIPMYGIQKFDPVGDYWLPGEFFNMSSDSHNSNRPEGYQYRSVFLLRSVAKVELKVSKHLGGGNVKPSSVYMASMNRSSRYEPKDFSTPTNLIWYGSEHYENNANYGYNGIYADKTIVGVDQEEGYIIDHLATASNTRNTPDFQNYTAWLYGIWEEIMEWDWNGHTLTPSEYDSSPFPRIFNDRVYRSNTVRFIYGGEVDGYYYYYLYMPEKYMDDDDNAGQLGDTEDYAQKPKVASIRLRFAEVDDDDTVLGLYNDDLNLENNYSYRIYFTDGGRNPKYSSIGRDGYSDYEKDLGTVHWPIIRNTLYRFTVDGLNSTDIKVEVCGAAERSTPEIEFK